MQAFIKKKGVTKLPGFGDPGLRALHEESEWNRRKTWEKKFGGRIKGRKKAIAMGAAELEAAPQLPPDLPVKMDRDAKPRKQQTAESRRKQAESMRAYWARRKRQQATA